MFVRLISCLLFCAFTIFFDFSSAAQAQRAAENAVAEADDAFGTVVGDEKVGLYSSNNARGFSPVEAGNLRINGLYFDQVAPLAVRVQRGSSIRVGLNALGYPVPAPTGVVDFRLRVPGENSITSVGLEHGALFKYARYTVEVDTQHAAIPGILSVGGGIAYGRNVMREGAVRDRTDSGGVIAHWTPSDSVSIVPFLSATQVKQRGQRTSVFIGDNAAPRFRATDRAAPAWSVSQTDFRNYGVTGSAEMPANWTLRGGVFRSETDLERPFTVFQVNVDATGRGDFIVAQNLPQHTQSTSGELRASKTIGQDGFRHTTHLIVRGRNGHISQGSGNRQSLGSTRIGEIPAFTPTLSQAISRRFTRTRQITGAAAYEGVWSHIGQFSASVQKTSYRQERTAANTSPLVGRQSPWLYSAAGVAYLAPRVAVYGGYAIGLEELGVAPVNAINREEAVPSGRTRQFDAGTRIQIHAGLQFVAGVFQIEKPYYALDQANIFREIGNIRHRGVEVSLAGALSDSLTLVAGAVFLQPHIFRAGSAAPLTAVGPLPRTASLNLQYAPGIVEGLIFDAKLENLSSQYLTVSNSRRVPGTTSLDVGIRYATMVSRAPLNVRLYAVNLTNSIRLTPTRSGHVGPSEGRRVALSITTDF